MQEEIYEDTFCEIQLHYELYHGCLCHRFSADHIPVCVESVDGSGKRQGGGGDSSSHIL